MTLDNFQFLSIVFSLTLHNQLYGQRYFNYSPGPKGIKKRMSGWLIDGEDAKGCEYLNKKISSKIIDCEKKRLKAVNEDGFSCLFSNFLILVALRLKSNVWLLLLFIESDNPYNILSFLSVFFLTKEKGLISRFHWLYMALLNS